MKALRIVLEIPLEFTIHTVFFSVFYSAGMFLASVILSPIIKLVDYLGAALSSKLQIYSWLTTNGKLIFLATGILLYALYLMTIFKRKS